MGVIGLYRTHLHLLVITGRNQNTLTTATCAERPIRCSDSHEPRCTIPVCRPKSGHEIISVHGERVRFVSVAALAEEEKSNDRIHENKSSIWDFLSLAVEGREHIDFARLLQSSVRVSFQDAQVRSSDTQFLPRRFLGVHHQHNVPDNSPSQTHRRFSSSVMS